MDSDLPQTLPMTTTQISHIFAAYITHLFGSSQHPYPSLRSLWQPHLPSHIATFLSRAPQANAVSIAIGSMTLLAAYKSRVPSAVAYDDDAYKLFLASYIVASKVMCDKPCTLELFAYMGSDKFGVGEVRRMEGELCRVLEWRVQIDEEVYVWFCRVLKGYVEKDSQEREGDGDGGVETRSPPPSYHEAIALSPPGIFTAPDSEDVEGPAEPRPDVVRLRSTSGSVRSQCAAETARTQRPASARRKSLRERLVDALQICGKTQAQAQGVQ